LTTAEALEIAYAPRLAERCFEVAAGDPLLALELAVQVKSRAREAVAPSVKTEDVDVVSMLLALVA
jgi:hypothetical protein